MCTSTHRRLARPWPPQAECDSLSAAASPWPSRACTTASDRLTRSAHRARSSSPESVAALVQSQSGSALVTALAHGSGAGSPPTTSVNQKSST